MLLTQPSVSLLAVHSEKSFLVPVCVPWALAGECQFHGLEVDIMGERISKLDPEIMLPAVTLDAELHPGVDRFIIIAFIFCDQRDQQIEF